LTLTLFLHDDSKGCTPDDHSACNEVIYDLASRAFKHVVNDCVVGAIGGAALEVVELTASAVKGAYNRVMSFCEPVVRGSN